MQVASANAAMDVANMKSSDAASLTVNSPLWAASAGASSGTKPHKKKLGKAVSRVPMSRVVPTTQTVIEHVRNCKNGRLRYLGTQQNALSKMSA